MIFLELVLICQLIKCEILITNFLCFYFRCYTLRDIFCFAKSNVTQTQHSTITVFLDYNVQMLTFLFLLCSFSSSSSSSSATASKNLAVRCFQCSEFPTNPDDKDEPLGPCPGFTFCNFVQTNDSDIVNVAWVQRGYKKG